MTGFNPASFTLPKSKPEFIQVMFQGPIAVGDTLPAVRKHPLLKEKDCYLVGYAGMKGCFSVVELSGGQVDVAFYEDTDPKGLTEVDVHNAVYEQYDVNNGWGFTALSKLVELLGEGNEIEHFITSGDPDTNVDDFL